MYMSPNKKYTGTWYINQYKQQYSRCPGLPASSLPVCPVYRCFFSCHPVTPVYRWHAGIPGWFIFSCSRSPSCCCTLPHTLLHTTQHNTLGVAGSSQHLPTHHAMCGRRIIVCPIEWLVLSCNGSGDEQ